MPKFLASLLWMLVEGIFWTSFQGLQSKNYGSSIPYTGAPKANVGFETTWISCHGGTVNSGPHSVDIAIAGNPTGFDPGQIYAIGSLPAGSYFGSAGNTGVGQSFGRLFLE